jgi:outer membrane lipoprotein-sorting protein
MKVLGRVALVAAVAVLAVSGLAFAGEKRIAQGKVTAVSDKSITVAGDNGATWTFEVTQGARVYGTGASHKTRMLASSGKLTTMDEFVRQGQFVTVYYQEKGGTRYLTQLRVL